MLRQTFLGAAMALAFCAMPLGAHVATSDDSAITGGGSAALPAYLQCVPYARMVSGIDIHGDAHTWWGQAKGRYARGFVPKLGAVMALEPHGNSRLGHVAAVSRIIDDRTILIRHANWSLIDGRRGQIEDNVRAVDVSPGNDWSEVRMWYAPIHALGGSHWPVQGFIYQGRAPETSREANRPSSYPLPALHLAYAPRHHEPAMRPLAAPVRHSGLSSHRLAPRAGRDPIGELIGARLGI